MFVAGQRWICDSELDLGLGTVLKSDHRTVTIVFLASGETRTYSQQTAPLRRAAFDVGDSVESHEGWTLTIKKVIEENGLLRYEGVNENDQASQLTESELSNSIQLNRPFDRVFSGQIDKNKWFDLRMETLAHQQQLKQSELTGLYDARTSLIPHQLYIAHEVAKRFAPRVLLADEVGLGKTIEACLIMQHQLITGRAKRVLIVVPEALLHQWLVELLRRFNLSFSVFNEERCEGITESSDFENPFHAEQLVLCTLPFLTENRERLEQAVNGNWDLVILDEAHHLHWSEKNPSEAYLAAEALASHSKGLLLLTATPEQLGKASHFARLRLLDPQRFHSYEDFLEEESHYQTLASAIEAILDHGKLEQQQIDLLSSWLGQSENADLMQEMRATLDQSAELDEQEKQKIINMLLDRHGTGRVLFRNTRHTIKGFPQRRANLYPLKMPEQYAGLYQIAVELELDEPRLVTTPERIFRIVSRLKNKLAGKDVNTVWSDFDSRIDFLIDLLEQYKQEKILIICASSATAKELEKVIRSSTGKRVSAFHEEMSIVERDRAASYFADMEDGAQALICSEIGSEGRNFQFAHHLVLFDLPLNPDLLEQRIGRLDRIGQSSDIEIHVPYFEHSAQDVLTQWYNKGLGAFSSTCQVGEAVYSKVEPMLTELLQNSEHNEEALTALIESTQKLNQEYIEALQKGRDRLLELNSYNSEVSQQLRSEIEIIDQNPQLQAFMEKVCDVYGVDVEDFKQGSYLIKPSPRMPSTLFSSLDEDGAVITYDRDVALANEDMLFITWNHPFVQDAIDLLISSEQGNTSLIAIKSNLFKPGTILAQTAYITECVFPEANEAGFPVQQAQHTYTLASTTNTLDETQLTTLLSGEISSVDKKTAYTIVKTKAADIKALLNKAEQLANQQLTSDIKTHQQLLTNKIQQELDRLITLQQVNPNIRDEEIQHYQTLLTLANDRLASTKLRLDAIRIIMTH